MSDWPNLSELLLPADASTPIGLVGAPLAAGSVTPGACDRAPALLRQTCHRLSRYDVEIGRDLIMPVADHGDAEIKGLSIEQATAPIRDKVAGAVGRHGLTLVIGGNNAVTRPTVQALGVPLDQIGLITLDAHFDMRDTGDGLSNGNPVRALMEDGLPGRNIAQVGLASFANTGRMHREAVAAGNLVVTIEHVRRAGIDSAIQLALDHLVHCDILVVDCDIDVIDRAQMPGAPGARPGGMAVHDFFRAVRILAGKHRVRVMDLTEWDPSLDPSDLTALTAARWLAECIAGYERR